MKPIEVAIISLVGFVGATLVAEWALRRVWPEDYPSQAGRH